MAANLLPLRPQVSVSDRSGRLIWAPDLRLAGRGRHSQPVASRRRNAGWLSCCSRCDVDGGSRVVPL